MPRAARVTRAGLTIKEDQFVREYVKHGNAELAYDTVYDPKNKRATWIRMEAARLLAREQIRERLNQLLESVPNAAEVSLEECIARARESYYDARRIGDLKGQNAANAILAKLGGHLIDRNIVDRGLGFVPTDELAQRRDQLSLEFRAELEGAGFTIEAPRAAQARRNSAGS